MRVFQDKLSISTQNQDINSISSNAKVKCLGGEESCSRDIVASDVLPRLVEYI